jgi:hypothetical protein
MELAMKHILERLIAPGAMLLIGVAVAIIGQIQG